MGIYIYIYELVYLYTSIGKLEPLDACLHTCMHILIDGWTDGWMNQ